MKLMVDFHEDNTAVTITFSSEPIVSVTLDTEQVDELLFNLGKCRSRMAPEVPERLPPDAELICQETTDTRIQKNDRNEVIISIRDLRYGWLHYSLGEEGAQLLASALTDFPPDPDDHIPF
jgi:hypothetical protein